MDIKKLNNNQNKQINSITNKWIKENFEEYYNTISKDYIKLFENVSYISFQNNLKHLILNGFDNQTPIITTSYYFYEENALQNTYRYLEELTEKSTEELLNFSDETSIYEEDYYNDDDYYLETLNTIFDTTNISKYFKSHYESSYISVSDEDIYINIIDELKNYDTFKDFIEDYEGNLLYNIDKEMLLIAYYNNFQNDVFTWFCDSKEELKEIKLNIELIKKNIIIELNKRIINNNNLINNQNKELEIYIKLINKSIQTEKNKIQYINNENKSIKQYLNK